MGANQTKMHPCFQVYSLREIQDLLTLVEGRMQRACRQLESNPPAMVPSQTRIAQTLDLMGASPRIKKEANSISKIRLRRVRIAEAHIQSI